MHAAWGQTQGGEAGAYQAICRVTPQQELIFKQINENLQVGSVASAHFIELMATMGYPGAQREAQTSEGVQGQGLPGRPPADPPKDRKQRPAAETQAGKEEGPRSAAARSRSRQAREARARAAAAETAARAEAAEEAGAAKARDGHLSRRPLRSLGGAVGGVLHVLCGFGSQFPCGSVGYAARGARPRAGQLTGMILLPQQKPPVHGCLAYRVPPRGGRRLPRESFKAPREDRLAGPGIVLHPVQIPPWRRRRSGLQGTRAGDGRAHAEAPTRGPGGRAGAARWECDGQQQGLRRGGG